MKRGKELRYDFFQESLEEFLIKPLQKITGDILVGISNRIPEVIHEEEFTTKSIEKLLDQPLEEFLKKSLEEFLQEFQEKDFLLKFLKTFLKY